MLRLSRFNSNIFFSQKGLTKFELVFVLCLCGVLLLIQLHAFKSLSAEFRNSFEKNTASSVQIGLLSYFVDPHRGNNQTYPKSLDKLNAGKCSDRHLCFGDVLPGGITAFWEKTGPMQYLGPSYDRHVWKYNPAAGEFSLLRERAA